MRLTCDLTKREREGRRKKVREREGSQERHIVSEWSRRARLLRGSITAATSSPTLPLRGDNVKKWRQREIDT